MSRGCWAALPYGAMGLSVVCDCGISLSYSLTIFDWVEDIHLLSFKVRESVQDSLGLSTFELVFFTSRVLAVLPADPCSLEIMVLTLMMIIISSTPLEGASKTHLPYYLLKQYIDGVMEHFLFAVSKT